ncbi:MAG: hypothetical protein ACTSW1_10020 [Candidatus Hodarchaeales archaeon]
MTQLFGNPIARILDQSVIVGKMEQTIAMLMESTNLSYKTVAKEVKRLVRMGYMEEGRKIGNATTYKFQVSNHLSGLIACAHKMQMERLKQEAMEEVS